MHLIIRLQVWKFLKECNNQWFIENKPQMYVAIMMIVTIVTWFNLAPNVAPFSLLITCDHMKPIIHPVFWFGVSIYISRCIYIFSIHVNIRFTMALVYFIHTDITWNFVQNFFNFETVQNFVWHPCIWYSEQIYEMSYKTALHSAWYTTGFKFILPWSKW